MAPQNTPVVPSIFRTKASLETGDDPLIGGSCRLEMDKQESQAGSGSHRG
jgi:hypothetical protein